MQKAIEIQGAAEIDVDFDQELKRLVKAGSLLKSEGEMIVIVHPGHLLFAIVEMLSAFLLRNGGNCKKFLL